MNKFAIIVASLFAVTAFAAEPAKTEVKAPVAATKEVKVTTPSKSEKPAVKDEKAATKPAATQTAK